MNRQRQSAAPSDVMPASKFGSAGMHRFQPVARARDVRGTVQRLFGVYMQEKRMLLLVLVLLMGSNVVLLIAPRVIGIAVNAIGALDLSAPDYGRITVLGVALLGGYLIDWALSTVQTWIMNGTSQRIVLGLREALFDKVQKLPLTYLDSHAHGELMSRLTNDIDNISSTIASSTSQAINALVMVLGSVIFMLILSPPLAAVTLITMPMVILLTRWITVRSKQQFIGQQRMLGEMGGMIEETISGLRMVKAFHQESRIVEQFSDINARLLGFSTQAQVLSGYLMPMINVITNLGYAFIAGVGGAMAVRGTIAVGTITSFIAYSRLFVRPLNEIAGTFNSIQSALAGAERVFDVLNQPQETPNVPDAIECTQPEGRVSFQNVSFAYLPGKDVLTNVSFDVEKGQTIALVGKTGAGKTTIVNLLTRFYDVTGGSILIDGHDIRSYTRESLRHAFTVVLQDTCLFTGTILDNIRYGNPDATEEQVVTAARTANADPFIRRLPQGYQTPVSGAVDSLSQGQRQLIAIARAVLCSAPILILDEATSSVDTKTELRIQEALLRFAAGRTSFVIAHRLSTIRHADRILVVDNGRIVESGTHAELLALGGAYAGMYHSQIGQ